MVSFIKLPTQQAVHDQSNKICVSLQLNQTMNIDNFVQFIHVLLQDTESQATYREPVQYINVNVYQKYIDFDLTSISSIVYSNHIPNPQCICQDTFAKELHAIASPALFPSAIAKFCAWNIKSQISGEGASLTNPEKTGSRGRWMKQIGIYIYIYDIWMWRQQ